MPFYQGLAVAVLAGLVAGSPVAFNEDCKFAVHVSSLRGMRSNVAQLSPSARNKRQMISLFSPLINAKKLRTTSLFSRPTSAKKQQTTSLSSHQTSARKLQTTSLSSHQTNAKKRKMTSLSSRPTRANKHQMTSHYSPPTSVSPSLDSKRGPSIP
jgi:hypothetical protein